MVGTFFSVMFSQSREVALSGKSMLIYWRRSAFWWRSILHWFCRVPNNCFFRIRAFRAFILFFSLRKGNLSILFVQNFSKGKILTCDQPRFHRLHHQNFSVFFWSGWIDSPHLLQILLLHPSTFQQGILRHQCWIGKPNQSRKPMSHHGMLENNDDHPFERPMSQSCDCNLLEDNNDNILLVWSKIFACTYHYQDLASCHECD